MLHLFRWLATDQTRGALILGWEDGQLRGGVLAVRSGTRCWYVLGATSKDNKSSVGHLLQWKAIQWAKDAGCLEYDFGGVREGVNTGPALFKRGFCDRVVQFLPPQHYVVSPGRHRTAELMLKVRRNLRAQRP